MATLKKFELPSRIQHHFGNLESCSCYIWLIKRPIYIGKNQNPKNLGFLDRLHCQKGPIHSGFLARKAHARKKPESHTCVFFARLLSTFDRTRVVRILIWRSRTTWPKTRIIPARLVRAFTLAKKVTISAEFQKTPFGNLESCSCYMDDWSISVPLTLSQEQFSKFCFLAQIYVNWGNDFTNWSIFHNSF